MSDAPRVHVLNGVNLGALGTRRPEVYGRRTLKEIASELKDLFPEADLRFFQTDYEGEMVGFVGEAAALAGALVINPGAWTHYSYAIHDALEAAEGVVKVEVHLSNVYAREEWRRRSVVSAAVDAVVGGMGVYGYRAAVGYALERLRVR